MSNSICVQPNCQSFLIYNKKEDNVLEPFIKEVCNFDGENVVTNFNLDGTPYQETIVEELIPDDVDAEKQLMCDGTASFIRWFVYVKSNPGLNFSYDTDLAGAAYTAAGTATAGDCNAGDDCETLVYTAVNGTTITPYRAKFCPGEDPVYYDQDNEEVDAGSISGTLVPAEDIDVEQQVMCDGTASFIRWFVYVKSNPGLNFSYDTDLAGAAYTAAGPATAGDCNAGDNCDTKTLYQRNDDTISPFLRKTCPGKDPVYYDIDGSEVDASTITGELLLPEDVDVEQQLMCDGTSTFIRWHVAIRGRPSGIYYDTDMNGVELAEAPDPDAVKFGKCPDCPTSTFIRLCDIDPGTTKSINLSELPIGGERMQLQGVEFAGTENEVEWSTETSRNTIGFYFTNSIKWEFSKPVTVDFTFFNRDLAQKCLTSSESLEIVVPNDRVTYNDSSKELCSSPIPGNDAIAVVRATNISEIEFTANDFWYLTAVTFVLKRDPIPFLQKTEAGCDGLVTISNVTETGEPYEVLGQIGECA